MGRYREYRSDAERQRAYRQRKAGEAAFLQDELRRLREGGALKAQKRKLASVKLVKVLGMLGSAHAGERDNAARMAVQILKDAGLTWYHRRGAAKEMTKGKLKEIAALPSGYVGVHRAGKRWEAYVMEKDLILLGVYATKPAAVAARAKYWKTKERQA
jgi:hypothetical protein